MENTIIDYQAIVEAIAYKCEDREGYLNDEIELDDDIYMSIVGEYTKEQYCEDDYFNGTGGWVTTEATIDIKDIKFYDNEGNNIDIGISIMKLESDVEDKIKRLH